MSGHGDADHEVWGELEIVAVCRDVRAGLRDPSAFDTAFGRATVYAQRSPGDRPGVMVSDLPGKGRWVLVFSTLERLVQQCGDVPWLSTTGSDLLDQLPHGVGVLLDVGDKHGLPLLPQPGGKAKFHGARLPPRPLQPLPGRHEDSR